MSNYDSGINDFNGPLVDRLLGDAGAREAFATDLVRTVTSQGWEGVVLDLGRCPRGGTGSATWRWPPDCAPSSGPADW